MPALMPIGALLAKALQTGLHNVCHIHLRRLAGTTVGLQNDMSSSKLRNRLHVAWRGGIHSGNLLRHKPYWFLKTQRPQTNANRLVVYRCYLVTPGIFQFDEVRAPERFAGAGGWDIYQYHTRAIQLPEPTRPYSEDRHRIRSLPLSLPPFSWPLLSRLATGHVLQRHPTDRTPESCMVCYQRCRPT